MADEIVTVDIHCKECGVELGMATFTGITQDDALSRVADYLCVNCAAAAMPLTSPSIDDQIAALQLKLDALRSQAGG